MGKTGNKYIWDERALNIIRRGNDRRFNNIFQTAAKSLDSSVAFLSILRQVSSLQVFVTWHT